MTREPTSRGTTTRTNKTSGTGDSTDVKASTPVRSRPALAEHGPLLGRHDELQRLTTLLTGGLSSAGGSLMLRGDAGVGKTRLLRKAHEIAASSGYLVLHTTGVEGAAPPFSGLRDLLPDDLVRQFDLPPTQAEALSSAFERHRTALAPEPFLVGMAALSVITLASEQQPVALIVDDAHWVDPESRTVIGFLGRRLAADPVVMVAAARPTHSQLDAVEMPTAVTLPPLEPAEAAVLLDSVATNLPADARQSILHVARGNPLALVELSRTWQARPSSPHDPRAISVGAHVRASFAGSYETLNPQSKAVLLLAALDEQTTTAEVLDAAGVLVGTPLNTDVIADAQAAGLVDTEPGRLSFRHPLIRTAIIGAATPERLREAHRVLAGVTHSGDTVRALLHRARATTGRDDQLADELAKTGQVARSRGENSTAMQTMEEAATLSQDSATRGHRLLLTATWAYELGARRVVERLVRSARQETLSDLDEIRARWLGEIFTGNVADEVGRISEFGQDVVTAWHAGDADLAWDVLMSTASRCYWTSPDDSTRTTLADTAQQLPVAGAEHRLVFTLSGIDQVAHTRRVLDECDGALTRGVDDANALRMYAMGAVVVGDAPLARVFVDEAERRLRAEGRLALLSHVLLTRIQADWVIGDWDRARVGLDEGRRLADETGQLTWRNSARLHAARLAVVTGEAVDVFELLDQVAHEAERQGTTSFLPRVQAVRGMAHVAAKDYDLGFDVLTRVFDPADTLHDARSTIPAMTFLAEAAQHTGRVHRARKLLAVTRAAFGPTPPSDLRVADEVATAMVADDDDAEALFRKALDGEAGTLPWPHARASLAYGLWLRRDRREGDAVVALQTALVGLNRLGASPWVEEARTNLRAAGVTDRSETTSPSQVLTPHELQIATLAAKGLSNREIGEHLFLSPRTVGSHLYRIFPKLGISSRAQLAALVGPQLLE